MLTHFGRELDGFAIGNPHETSVLHIAETIRELTGSSSEIVFVPRPTDDPSVRQPDIGLAREQLGWEPQVRFDEGLERTVAWYRDNRAWWEPIRSGDYRAYYERQYGRSLG